MWLQLLFGIIILVAALVSGMILFVFWLLDKIFLSVQPVSPQKAPEKIQVGKLERNPLFRHVPQLKQKLLWSELGAYPTPIHEIKLKLPEKVIAFWMKREDLSSGVYGGNKIRTLQYQIPVCVAHVAAHPSAKFYIIGSGGSNQVVATMAHGTGLGLKFEVCYPRDDAPDLDNTLNFLSTLSFRPTGVYLWDRGLYQLKLLLKALNSKDDKVFGLGGNSIPGILGQIGGALELAEQIERGEVPDIDEIYLPMGSSCTTAGLILGVCLARYLMLPAFKSQRFKIVSVIIHGDFVALNHKTNLMRNWIGNYFALAPRYGIRRVSAYLEELCGIDLKPAAMNFLEREWECVDEFEIAGKYGAHSEKSAKASAYDVDLQVIGECPDWLEKSTPPPPWLCGHFTGKAFAVLLDRLRGGGEKVNALFWQTKSYVQPLGGKDDEWEALRQRAAESKVLKAWADDGKAASLLRQGKVDLDNGKPEDYRKLMTPVNI